MQLDPMTGKRLKDFRNSYRLEDINNRRSELLNLRNALHKNRRYGSAKNNRKNKQNVNLNFFKRKNRNKSKTLNEEGLYKMIWKNLLYLIEK